MKYLHQKGDTIVEVLIAMAVLSLVLAGAYASARRSLNATIQANEHSTALKIAEEQQEKLKYLSTITTSGSGIYHPSYASTASFCVDGSLALQPATSSPTAAASATDLSVYTNPCKRDIGQVYYMAIGRDGSNVFTIYVRWHNIHGKGQDQVTLSYKLDK